MTNPLEKASDRLSAVSFKLRKTIPARADNDDVVIAEGIRWAKERIEHLDADRKRISGIAKQRYEEIRRLRDEARDFGSVMAKFRGLMNFVPDVAPCEIADSVVRSWHAKGELQERLREKLAKANSTIERLGKVESDLCELQQILDECVVAAGSKGLLPSDLPKEIRGLREAHSRAVGELFGTASDDDLEPPSLAGMTLEQAAQARMALGDGEFADLPTFADAMQALREEIADGRNYLDLLLRLGLPERLAPELNDCLQDSWRWCEDAEAQQRCDQHGWRPIETAPKDGTDVLVCCQGWVCAHPARWNGKRWTHRWNDAELVPTHWRPMPELPVMEEMSNG